MKRLPLTLNEAIVEVDGHGGFPFGNWQLIIDNFLIICLSRLRNDNELYPHNLCNDDDRFHSTH